MIFVVHADFLNEMFECYTMTYITQKVMGECSLYGRKTSDSQTWKRNLQNLDGFSLKEIYLYCVQGHLYLNQYL